MSESGRPITTDLAAVAGDCVQLAELQLRLFSLDLRQFWAGARWGVTLGALALVLTLGAIPVLLAGIAFAVARWFSMPQEYACLVVGGTATGIGIGLLSWAVRRALRAATALRRTQEELDTNLRWLRRSLSREQTPPSTDFSQPTTSRRPR